MNPGHPLLPQKERQAFFSTVSYNNSFAGSSMLARNNVGTVPSIGTITPPPPGFFAPPAMNATSLRSQASQPLSKLAQPMHAANEANEKVNLTHMQAEQGYASAQRQLGQWYLAGMGVEKNVFEGIKWLEMAAVQGDVWAMEQLQKVASGHIVPSPSLPASEPLDKISMTRLQAEQGFASAQRQLGQWYLTGMGVNKNETEGIKWLEMAAAQGDARAIEQLQKIASSGSNNNSNNSISVTPTEPSISEPVDKITMTRLQAEQGFASAQRQLGQWYLAGMGVNKNETEGIKWLEMAAAQGDARAIEQLQKMASINKSSSVTITSSSNELVDKLTWTKQQAQQGNASCQRQLGQWHLNGVGVEKDEEKGIAWLSLAAAQGDSRAMDQLSKHYSTLMKAKALPLPTKNFGVATPAEAVNKFESTRSLAAQGNSSAQRQLGVWYLTGLGIVEKDEKEGLAWLSIAASQGDTRAAELIAKHFSSANKIKTTLSPSPSAPSSPSSSFNKSSSPKVPSESIAKELVIPQTAEIDVTEQGKEKEPVSFSDEKEVAVVEVEEEANGEQEQEQEGEGEGEGGQKGEELVTAEQIKIEENEQTNDSGKDVVAHEIIATEAVSIDVIAAQTHDVETSQPLCADDEVAELVSEPYTEHAKLSTEQVEEYAPAPQIPVQEIATVPVASDKAENGNHSDDHNYSFSVESTLMSAVAPEVIGIPELGDTSTMNPTDSTHAEESNAQDSAHAKQINHAVADKITVDTINVENEDSHSNVLSSNGSAIPITDQETMNDLEHQQSREIKENDDDSGGKADQQEREQENDENEDEDAPGQGDDGNRDEERRQESCGNDNQENDDGKEEKEKDRNNGGDKSKDDGRKDDGDDQEDNKDDNKDDHGEEEDEEEEEEKENEEQHDITADITTTEQTQNTIQIVDDLAIIKDDPPVPEKKQHKWIQSFTPVVEPESNDSKSESETNAMNQEQMPRVPPAQEEVRKQKDLCEEEMRLKKLKEEGEEEEEEKRRERERHEEEMRLKKQKEDEKRREIERREEEIRLKNQKEEDEKRRELERREEEMRRKKQKEEEAKRLAAAVATVPDDRSVPRRSSLDEIVRKMEEIDSARMAAKEGNVKAQTWLGTRLLSETVSNYQNNNRMDNSNGNSTYLSMHDYVVYSYSELGDRNLAISIDAESKAQCEEAVFWLTKAAEQGDPDAQYNLGRCYERGYGVPMRLERSLQLYRMAATKHNHLDAQNALGNILRDYAENVPNSMTQEKEAVDWYRKAAEQGHVCAMVNLAICLEHGLGGNPVNLEVAAQWYTKAVEKQPGHPHAEYMLGIFYLLGKGVGKNDEHAAHYFLQAGKQGHEKAQIMYASCLLHGLGVPRDVSRGVLMLEKAVQKFPSSSTIATSESARLSKYNMRKKDAHALYQLALCYRQGLGVSIDKQKALQLFWEAAELGHSASMYEAAAGYCYLSRSSATSVSSGLSPATVQSYNKMIYLLQGAAKLNHLNACYELGQLYHCGLKGVLKRDKKQSLHYYEKAAKLGHLGAICEMFLAKSNGHIINNIHSDNHLSFYFRQQEVSYFDELNQHRVTKDDIELLKKAAELGSNRARLILAISCERGIGIEKNARRAFIMYEILSENEKFHPATYFLARCLHYGIGTDVNQSAALNKYRMAADAGVAVAHAALSIYYERNEPEKISQMISHMRIAADLGDTESKFRYGMVQYRGYKGSETNMQLAIKYISHAAYQGHHGAMRLLIIWTNQGLIENDILFEKLKEQQEQQEASLLMFQ